MKQNSSILFHPMPNSLIIRCLRVMTAFACFLTSATAAEAPAFNPVKRFKPAQRNLTAIYLQIAESLRYHGSPMPYLWHVKAESERIATEYKKTMGREGTAHFPAYMDDAYMKRLSSNWDILASKIGLESMTKNIGRLVSVAILGENGSGTILVDVLDNHDKLVLDSLQNGGEVSFESLKEKIISEMRLGETGSPQPTGNRRIDDAVNSTQEIRNSVQSLFKRLDAGLPPEGSSQVKTVIESLFTDVGNVAECELQASIIEWALKKKAEPEYTAKSEKALTPAERKIFAAFLGKQRFTKADFATLDAFYKTAYDKLSEQGKEELSKRIRAGMR